MSDPRQVISAGEQDWPRYRHLVPIARFLVDERGHLLIDEFERWGFGSTQNGRRCRLTGRITAADWAAINERFVIPANIWFDDSIGLIRDQDNRVSFIGAESIINVEGYIETAEEHAAALRREGLGRGPD